MDAAQQNRRVKMNKLDCIVVLYNTRAESCISISGIINSSYVNEVILCDNSNDNTIRVSNSKFANQYSNCKYVDMGGNQGLSVAYNAGIAYITTDFFCILDDDTSISAKYLEQVCMHLTRTNKQYDIYLPVVIGNNNKIMSPCKIKGKRYECFDDVKKICYPFSAINSGMVINRKIFDKYKYDERYFLDMIDHQFMKDIATSDNTYIMNDTIIRQDFSSLSDSKAQALKRLKIYANDAIYFYGSTVFGKIFVIIQLVYRFIKILLSR